jgi:hypothetical protein
MPDVLSQGGDRAPNPRRRRLVVIAVAVIVAVVVVLQLPRHHGGSPHASPSPSPTGGQLAVPTGGPSGVAAPAPVITRATLPVGASGILGPTLRWESALRLPVTGPRPTWFSPATGRMERIGGLPAYRPGYVFTRVGGGWAIQPATNGQPGCGTCVGLTEPVYFLADRASAVTRIGSAHQVAPAARPGAVWLTSYVPGADTSTARGTAREVSVTGRRLGPPSRLPASYLIQQATGRGLLLAPQAQAPQAPGSGPAADLLWDPGTGQVRQRFPDVIAVSSAALAWMPQCASGCPVHVVSLAGGPDALVRLRPGTAVASAAFSPDGGLLAMQLIFSSGSDSGATSTELAVASARTGRLTPVPGTSASSDALVGFGWPDSGHSLVALMSFTTRVQVASWRPGAARLAVAAVQPGAVSTSMVVG